MENEPIINGYLRRMLELGGSDLHLSVDYPPKARIHGNLQILEDEFAACSDELIVMTDDGSYARQGNVTVPLKEMLEAGRTFDKIITIGPLIMMKFVVLTAKEFQVPCTVSMNPIMIDGTGMCGGCRLTLN